MRFEIIDRQRFKHAVLVAQLLLAVSAYGETKPMLLVIGHPTGHGWKTVEHPAFTTRVVDPDLEPRLAAAYTSVARIVGATGDPLYVVVTPYMEPVAASAADRSFLDRAATRWATDRDGLLAEAGLAVRRHLLKGGSTSPPDPRSTQDLHQLVRGPLYDHIGGGFFRGTRGNIPYFDKSLADQAYYAHAYLSAWQKSRDPVYADVVRATLDFVLSDLTDRSGLFVAGLHADSLVARAGPEILEGGHYVWQAQEIRNVLGPRIGDIVVFHYGAKDEGNMPKQSDFYQKNVLVPRAQSETIAKFSITRQELDDLLKTARQTLLEVRSKRPKPEMYPAIATSHIASMISALARASIAFDDPRYADAALRAARALRPKNLTPEEHAMLVRGLFDVYEATFDPSLLERANALTPGAPEQIPEPVAVLAPKSEVKAPSLDQFRHVVVAGHSSRDDTEVLVRAVRERQKPDQMLFFVGSESTRRRLAALMPYFNDIAAVDEPVAMICERRACRPWTE